MPVVTLKFAGAPKDPETDAECIKAEVADTGLSESTCGNGNSDLYEALIAIINGNPLPVKSSPSDFSASMWVQDQVGNGYEATIARGDLVIKEQVSKSPTELFDISPEKIVDGVFDLGKDTGWIIDKIWSASWAGYVTDKHGNNTAKPGLSISAAQIKLSPGDGVYGCLRVKYSLTRDRLTVNNDGGGEADGDPYSTSVSFDVDGCDEERTIQLPTHQCLLDALANPYGVDGLLEIDAYVERPLPEEQPVDTERRYRYCDRKFISASPRAAGAGYEGTCLGVKCGDCGDEDAE